MLFTVSRKMKYICKENLGFKDEDDISIESYQPIYDERFNFNELKATCDDLTTSSERINLLNDRLIDLKQWELQYDVVLKDCEGFKFSPDFYPNFSQLCAMELTRQEKMLEFESRILIPSIPIQSLQAIPILASKYVWKAKDTDLLELFCSLCLEDAIGRSDGGKMTRKELIGVFEDLFGIQIKDAEGKLNKATNRNDKTPFLDKLRTAFQTYSRDKDEKIRVRA
jgi:RteC protein